MSSPPFPAGAPDFNFTHVPPFNGPGIPSDPSSSGGSSNVVNSKIMVVAVAVLFAVVLFILCLHIYAKWFWRNQGVLATGAGGPRALSWRRRRRYREDGQAQNQNAALVGLQSVGLDRAVVEALPTFEYKSEEMKQGMECAVCLEEFEEGEHGRTLPKCGHNFHLDCIDMWLHSHSTCPLCRATVRPDEEKPTQQAAGGQLQQPQQQVQLDLEQRPEADGRGTPVVSDVQAPFMAAMRASRRMRRGLGLSPALTNPTVCNSLPRTSEDQQEGQENQTNTMPESTSQQSLQPHPHGKGSDIPSNVLFWGTQTHMMSATAPPLSQHQNPQEASLSLLAPFQVSVDISRGQQQQQLAQQSTQQSATADPNSPFSNLVVSPMARASASFRRLLSRGKSLQAEELEGFGPGPSNV